MDNLSKYNSKRNFQYTKEPKGIKEKHVGKLKFVVQKHFSSREHYDLRLEWNEVLKSWAIPKGPSYNINDKRLAIEVEDHPLSYRNFEGVIPKGEYGAGHVMIWDEGTWQPLQKINKNFNIKNIKFNLYGKRLKGKWALVNFKDNNWLLIKEKDNINRFENINSVNKSIKSKKNVKEINEKKIILKRKNINNIPIEITNPDKIVFKNPKITKLDLIMYYWKVFDRMMPFLDKRLISTIRCPDGFNGNIFFKKHLENINEGLGKIIIPSKTNKKNDYYYIKNKIGLLSEVQMNSYEFHIWGSKITNLNKPDIMVFDLDPDEKLSLKKLREGVKDLKNILDELNLISFLKTSGGKGYHVFLPIKVNSWKKFTKIAKNIAFLMEKKWPDKYVSNMKKSKRKNKIFIDWIRNTKSSTSASPYSIRIKNAGTVSMPIKWSELDKIAPNDITIEEAIKRLKRKDPWKDFFK